jgi:2-keto-4-pentenoate hydratase/2-oxohepta-3-ene-1,7-dioic acid hydratase in catechol pathway
MRFISWKKNGAHGGVAQYGLAVRRGADLINLEGLDLMSILQAGAQGMERAASLARTGRALDPAGLEYLPPVQKPPKIVCVGMNYQDHADENKLKPQTHPTFFARFISSLLGHQQPILRPTVSDTLDFEGELAAVIGKPGRHIPVEKALDHVAGYSIFNDASVREYQSRGQQWTLGKNFDNTGAFGPEFVTADELPRGAAGLKLATRLNGATVQSANTGELIFDVATLISRLSEVTTLETGDVIVTGTPAGIGFFRDPKLYMKPGDVCEVEIEGLGTLRNPIQDERA